MTLRDSHLSKLQQQTFDALIVGGGINGAVSAAALTAKGAKVALIDKGDFAGFCSSNSSNLAWGGIKYLESHEYGLVYKLCKSRNHLMQHYPSSVKEIRFLTSIQKRFRYPSQLIFLGTILYWLMGKCMTLAPKLLSRAGIKQTESVINTQNVQGGFEYSDCYLQDNDSRFVFNFIRQSMSDGCAAANYVEALNVQKRQGDWVTTVKDKVSNHTFSIRSRVFINAAGPFVDNINRLMAQSTQHHHVFSKGIHLIVNQITSSGKVLTFFADDGRLFFVIPMGRKTCIGTTDQQVSSPYSIVTEQDRNFVLENVNRLLDLKQPLTPDDIIAERCGVRPLALKGSDGKADWVQLSRKHAVDTDVKNKHISIFGGKLTDCINVGEEIVQRVESLGITLPYRDKKWYGEPPESARQAFMHRAKLLNLDSLTPLSSSEPLSERFWRRYGEGAMAMLESVREFPEKAELVIKNAEYVRVELEYAARSEMITKLDDFLRRRSKIALVVKSEDILSDPGLLTACEILFGPEAEEKRQEYLEKLGLPT